MNNILRYAVISGVFSIPFIVLIVSKSMFFPFITGKNFTFRIIVEIIFALWAILALRDAAYRPKFSWMLLALASFVGIIALADIFGENPIRSFWSNYERMEGLITLLHLLAYFIVLGSILQTKILWQRLFQTSLFVSLIVSIYSFIQLSGNLPINQGEVRVDATLGNATYLAIYLVFHIFIALLLMAQSDAKRWQCLIYGILIALQTIVLYHTATRGAILGLIGGLLLTALLLALFEKENRFLRRGSIAAIVSVTVLVGIFISVRQADFVQNSPVLSRFANISLNETKTQARAYVWPMAIEGFKERPILGWGQENFNYVFNKYYDPRMFQHEPWFDRTHDIILDWLIAGGILGLLGYLSLYLLGLHAVWRKGDLSLTERAILTGLLAAYFFHNLFVFDNITSYVMFVIILSYLHFDTAKEFTGRLAEKISLLISDQSIINRFVAPIVVVAAVFAIYFFNAKAIAANTTLIQAISSDVQKKGVVPALEGFKKALSYDTLGNQEIREQLIQAALALRSASGISAADREAAFKLAKSEYEKMAAAVPNDARHHLFLGGLLTTYGLYGDGLKELQRAHELSPKKQMVLFEIGVTLISTGKYAEALSILKEAYEFEPNYEEARLMYAMAAIYAGENDLVEKLLVPVFGTVSYPSDRLLRAYFDTRQYDRIVEVWENQVKAYPNNARFHAALAAAYFQVGRREDSVNELLKARDLETDPNNKAEYERIISDIRAGKNPI